MIRKIYLFLWIFLISNFAFSQEQIKIAFYNLFEYPRFLPTNRTPILKDILTDIDPDLFLVCELLNEEGADDILYNAMDYSSHRNFERASFVSNQSSNSNLQQLLFYDKNVWNLEAIELLKTNYRDINKYKLRLRTQEQANPIFLYAFVTHLKSSSGGSNQQIRLEMIEVLTRHLKYIEEKAFVLFAGDFNLYSSDEPAYQELLNPENSVIFVDPLNSLGDWHQNEDFSFLHTQATRLSNVGFQTGASGGMDDRFDFILLSENLMDNNPNLRYVENSYAAYGNNGNCYKKDIHDPSCEGVYSQEIREQLFWMSDHLPVILKLETQRRLLGL